MAPYMARIRQSRPYAGLGLAPLRVVDREEDRVLASDPGRDCSGFTGVQVYLAHREMHPPMTLQQPYAQGPMVAGWDCSGAWGSESRLHSPLYGGV